MNIALVDDDAGDRLRLEQLLKEYGTIHGLDLCIDQFSDAEAFLRGYESFRYAVIFLDIYMDGLSGIEAAREIRKVDDDAKLVFLTSSESHRADAFDLFAVSYLGKPCAQEQVFRTLDHILRLRTDGEKRFSFSYNRQSFSLLLGEIVSLETEGNYLVIADCQGRTYRTRMTFFAAMKQLDPRFMELQKGIAVNMDRIAQIQDGRCRMQSGTVFPLRVRSRKELREKWLNYKFAKIREETAALGGEA